MLLYNHIFLFFQNIHFCHQIFIRLKSIGAKSGECNMPIVRFYDYDANVLY